jgi:hypothetical protein
MQADSNWGSGLLQNALLLNHMGNQVQTPASEDCTWGPDPSSKTDKGLGRMGNGMAPPLGFNARTLPFCLSAFRRRDSHNFVTVSKWH